LDAGSRLEVSFGGPPLTALSVRDLDAASFDRAYPLARAAMPGLSQAAWQRYLRGGGRPTPSGLLGVENPQRVLLGLAVWRQCHGLEQGPCLIGDPVLVFDLVGGSLVASVPSGPTITGSPPGNAFGSR